MPGKAAYIAGDWGTTNARFWLCDADGGVLAEATGPGVAPLRDSGRFSEAFASATEGWPVDLPAVLCGTIGANIGWRQVGYRTLPAALDKGGKGALRFENGNREVAILAGVSGANSYGAPDLMRGEETQLAGLFAMGMASGIFVLPGTHNKWAIVRDGTLDIFHTTMTGELFAAVAGHTILVTDSSGPPVYGQAFDRGARLALEQARAGLASLIFTTRTSQVLGQMHEADAASYLSGIMIGSDVASGMALCGITGESEPVTLVGGAALTVSYARALELAGCKSSIVSGDDAVRRGLTLAWRQMFG